MLLIYHFFIEKDLVKTLMHQVTLVTIAILDGHLKYRLPSTLSQGGGAVPNTRNTRNSQKN